MAHNLCVYTWHVWGGDKRLDRNFFLVGQLDPTPPLKIKRCLSLCLDGSEALFGLFSSLLWMWVSLHWRSIWGPNPQSKYLELRKDGYQPMSGLLWLSSSYLNNICERFVDLPERFPLCHLGIDILRLSIGWIRPFLGRWWSGAIGWCYKARWCLRWAIWHRWFWHRLPPRKWFLGSHSSLFVSAHPIILSGSL